jgi:hypothetical protein
MAKSYKRKFIGVYTDNSKLYRGMSKPHAAILVQARSGKIGLKSYLYKIKRADSPNCECDRAEQTVNHIIEECPLFRTTRKELLGRVVIRNAIEVMEDPKRAKLAVQLLLRTGLLDQFRIVRQEQNTE